MAAYIGGIAEVGAEGAFVGRAAELAAVADAAADALAGRSRVVWIEGPPGTGKTSLVRAARRDLAAFTHVQGEADELSMDAPFSLLEQFGPVGAANAFAAGLALVERLGTMQVDAPVALVAEDLHWADSASRGALLTAARRLHHDHVVILVTTRPSVPTDDWDRFSRDPERCTRLVLGGLDDGEVGTLATALGIPLSPAQAARLQRHTAGHALHVRTLLGELSPEQLRSTAGELPAPRSLAAATVAMVAELPPDAQALAAALAVLGIRTPLAVAAGVGGVERPGEALELLLASGLVAWSPTDERKPVEFAHPLYRTAVYEDLSPTRRRHLHLASAAQTRWGPSWAHRVAATETSDDVLADELEDGARYEVAREALGQAATYLSWSSTMTSSRARAEERLLLGARWLIIDGQTAKASGLYPRIADCAESPLRDLVLGMLAFAEADAATAERWLGGVGRLPQPTPDWVRAEALAQLALLHSLHGRGAEVAAAAESALARGPTGDHHIDDDVWWGVAIGTAMVAGSPAGLARLHARLPQPAADVTGTDAELLVVRAMLRDLSGHTGAALVDFRAAIELARRGFGFSQLPRAHLALSRALVNAGDWDEALVQARTALSLMDEHRVWMRAQAEATMVPVLAARGDLELAATYAAAATEAAAELGTTEIDAVARVAVAALARARADPTAVIDALAPFAGDGVPIRCQAPMTMLAWWPLLVEALVDAGRLDDAAAHLGELAATADRQGLDITAHLQRLHGRLAVARAAPDAAADAFAVALAHAGPDHPALDRALLHRDYGRLLRARGARREALLQLQTAHELLGRLGATPYQRAVADDLADWGAVQTGATRLPFALTSREEDVVALVRKGFTNREVGAQLYISAKAVEYHLGNVYGKLGIRSRRELRDLTATG